MLHARCYLYFFKNRITFLLKIYRADKFRTFLHNIPECDIKLKYLHIPMISCHYIDKIKYQYSSINCFNPPGRSSLIRVSLLIRCSCILQVIRTTAIRETITLYSYIAHRS